MSRPTTIRIPPPPPPNQLTEEDVRWEKMMLRALDGLAAIAEINAEGCETGWMAMHCALENLRDTQKMIVEEFEKRVKGEET